MSKAKNVWRKFVISSEDPKKISLTIKGLLTAILPGLMIYFGLGGDDINSMIDAIERIVYLTLSLIATIQVVWGLFRKVTNRRWTAA